MATTLLTLQGIQDAIHVQYTNANDTPAIGSTDWNVRLSHINNAIAYWDAQKAVEWNELWNVGNSTASIITASITQYSMPTDFNYMGGYIRLVLANGSKKAIPIIQSERAQSYINQSQYGAYISGKPGSYKLNLLWNPLVGDTYTGSTIEFDYYKYPLAMSAPTDVPEMSNPWFIVHFVTAKLFQTQSPTNYNIHNNLSVDMLNQMMQANQLTGLYNNSPNGVSFTIGG